MLPNKASIRRQRALKLSSASIDPTRDLNTLFEEGWIFVEEIVSAGGTVLILEREEYAPLVGMN